MGTCYHRVKMRFGNLPPTAAHKVAGGVAKRNPRYVSLKTIAANGGAQHALLWHPVGVQIVVALRFRGFSEYTSPPATLYAAVGGKNTLSSLWERGQIKRPICPRLQFYKGCDKEGMSGLLIGQSHDCDSVRLNSPCRSCR